MKRNTGVFGQAGIGFRGLSGGGIGGYGRSNTPAGENAYQVP